jgi:hypothetical protein
LPEITEFEVDSAVLEEIETEMEEPLVLQND